MVSVETQRNGRYNVWTACVKYIPISGVEGKTTATAQKWDDIAVRMLQSGA